MPTALAGMWSNEMGAGQFRNCRCSRENGFTLLEVLVALVIIATAFGASLRAVGSLTQNSEALRTATLASLSAENRLVQIRLQSPPPAYGMRRFSCPQANLNLICAEEVLATPNAHFRRVEVRVFEGGKPDRALAHLSHMVSDAR